ncbi:unnamed protein product [Microthlaspi erraticum]|uniref:Uncharacterized protein n=1 Tax=Microthlaspi erraticum TaxID=1685480 RepID=A0A6D2JNK5_9BRAS|nr:unnamed protein product [Microthlaspi erraticum]
MMMKRRSPFCLDLCPFYSSPASARISPASMIFGISCCTCSGFSGISTEQLTPDFSGLRRTTLTKCMRTRSSRSTEDLVELDFTRVERDSQRGMETLWAMDSVELGKLDRLVKEMLQTATNRDKGLFHHQCRTTTLRSSWE